MDVLAETSLNGHIHQRYSHPSHASHAFDLLKQAANDSSSESNSESTMHQMGRDVAISRADSNSKPHSTGNSHLPTNSSNLTSSGSMPTYVNQVLGGRETLISLTSLTEKLPPANGDSNGQHSNHSHKSSEKPYVGNKRDASHLDIDEYDVNNRQIVSSIGRAASSAPTNSTTPAPNGTGQTMDDSEKGNYMDITEYLNLPQTDAAKKLGIPTSTLSKRWKEAVVNRKWPYRTVAKLDKEIMTLLHNIPQGQEAPPLPAEIEHSLGILLRKRQEELRTVVIRL